MPIVHDRSSETDLLKLFFRILLFFFGVIVFCIGFCMAVIYYLVVWSSMRLGVLDRSWDWNHPKTRKAEQRKDLEEKLR